MVFSWFLSFKTFFVKRKFFVFIFKMFSKNFSKILHPIFQNMGDNGLPVPSQFSANNAELLNVNSSTNGKKSFDLFREASTANIAPSAKVINVQIFDSISFPNKDIIEPNMYFCVGVRRTSGALAMKHKESISRIPCSPCGEKKVMDLFYRVLFP